MYEIALQLLIYLPRSWDALAIEEFWNNICEIKCFFIDFGVKKIKFSSSLKLRVSYQLKVALKVQIYSSLQCWVPIMCNICFSCCKHIFIAFICRVRHAHDIFQLNQTLDRLHIDRQVEVLFIEKNRTATKAHILILSTIPM